MSGGIAVRTERPGSLRETADLIRDTEGPMLFRGGGTKFGWGGAVDQPDTVIETSRLSGLLTHNAADLTASARAGTTLSELQETLAAAGQWLAVDPAGEEAGATIGGVLATADSGPSRLRYGSLRDLVIGVTIVVADGTVARSGGHVIKNVAGYDLAKLLYGSLGSLALIAEVVFRLHPRAVESRTIIGTADASNALDATLRLTSSVAEPAAVEWIQDGESGRIAVRADGTPRTVEAAAREMSGQLAAAGIRSEVVDPEAAAAFWRQHQAGILGTAGDTVLRVATLPDQLVDTLGALDAAAVSRSVRTQVVSSTALGLHTIRLSGGSGRATADLVADFRRHAARRGGSTVLRSRPPEVDRLVDALGPVPSTVGVLRRAKAAFDPANRCAPGRFRPWY
ncbi:FAD-binding oxidoreductase [Nakamurella sp. GG22]